MKKSSRDKKYFAPQNQGEHRKCDCPGCEKAGEYRAPKNRNLHDYYWFCLEHVQAYNAEWNYYENETALGADEKENKKSRMHFKDFRAKADYRYGYKLKDDFGFFGDYGGNFASRTEVYFNEKEREFLKVMELAPEEANLESLKKQYKILAKKYHPDLNRGDKQAEEKFKRLMIAYHSLVAKFS